MFLILGVIVQIVKFWEHGNTFCGMKFTTWYITRGILTLWQKVVERACVCICLWVCVRVRVRVSGMELCNGYRYWTLESRLMNTKHVNSRGKTVEWVPSSSFGQCLRSIEEVDVEAREPRPLTRQTVLHESTSVNSAAVAHQEKMQTSNMHYLFLSHFYLVIVRNSNNKKK